MDTPSKRGLSFTLSWGALEAPKSATLSLGAALRILLLLSVGLGSYELGRRTERLAAKASAPASAVVVVEAAAVKPIGEAASNAAAGRPIAEKDDVITPLNVRDPSALVMGPSVGAPPPAADVPPTPPSTQGAPARPRARLFPPKDPKVLQEDRF